MGEMSKPDDIPQDVWDEAAKCVPDYVKRTIVEKIARAILAAKDTEQDRCLDICAAEREGGDFHPDDVMGKISRGEQARVIPGWNAPAED